MRSCQAQGSLGCVRDTLGRTLVYGLVGKVHIFHFVIFEIVCRKWMDKTTVVV